MSDYLPDVNVGFRHQHPEPRCTNAYAVHGLAGPLEAGATLSVEADRLAGIGWSVVETRRFSSRPTV